MVDAGVTSIDRAQKLFESNVSKLIIGTETLQSKNLLPKLSRFLEATGLL